jgi:hypothetical protein
MPCQRWWCWPALKELICGRGRFVAEHPCWACPPVVGAPRDNCGFQCRMLKWFGRSRGLEVKLCLFCNRSTASVAGMAAWQNGYFLGFEQNPHRDGVFAREKRSGPVGAEGRSIWNVSSGVVVRGTPEVGVINRFRRHFRLADTTPWIHTQSTFRMLNRPLRTGRGICLALARDRTPTSRPGTR